MEGSLALAASMTIKNTFNGKDNLIMSNDIYEGHIGTPDDVKPILTYPMWKENFYTVPVLTIGY